MTLAPSEFVARAAGLPAIDWQAALVEHGRWLRLVVLARVGEREAADEVLQEVSLAAVRQQAPLTDATKLCPWLYQLAVRQCLLYRRQRGRARKLVQRVVERQPLTEHDAGSLDPLDWLLAAERQAAVRQGLGRLPARDREILLLKYSEGWSYQQLAAHLGTTHSAIEARLHRARGRLRQELAALDPVVNVT